MAETREYGRLYPVAKRILTPGLPPPVAHHVEGLDNVPAEGGAIICPNHTSVIDSFFLPVVLPRRITFVGKAEYMDSWKTKYLFPAIGMIPIDRGGGIGRRAGPRHRRPGARAGRAVRHLPRGHPGPRRQAPQGPHRPGPAGPAHRRADRPGRASAAPATSSRPTPRFPKPGSRSTHPLRAARSASSATATGPTRPARAAPDHRRGDVRDPRPVGPGVRRHVRHEEGRGAAGRGGPRRARRRRPTASGAARPRS